MSDISVVIPLYQDGDTIEACVQAVLAQEPAPREIIVVDNGSSDRGPSHVARLAEAHSSVRLIHEPVPGPAAARNRGWREARSSFVAFVDADCLAESGWLQGIRDAFTTPQVGLVGGRIRGCKPRSAVEKALAITSTQDPRPPYEVYRYAFVRGGLPSGNLAARVATLLEIDGFDVHFRIGEDHDLCARAARAGWTLRFAPDAGVVHCNYDNVRGQIRQSFGYGRAHAHLFRHHADGEWIVAIPRRIWSVRPAPGRAWLALETPGKIILGSLLASWISPWFLLLLAGYIFHYARSTRRLLELHSLAASGLEFAKIIACRATRALAMDAGRLVGSLRYRVVCL